MSLSRAFTTRRNPNKKSLDISPPMPQRSLTTKRSFASGSIHRAKISAPVELISTTNMLSYNAPDLYPSSNTSDSISENDSENSPTSRSSTPPTSPDSSSVEYSPSTPEPNHLSCYFGGGPPTQSKPTEGAPVIPQRALSHTKKSSMSLSSKRSTGRMSSAKNSIHQTRSSINMFAANVEAVEEPMDHRFRSEPKEHPFGNELAQVSELAEEYGVQENMHIIDEEEIDLIQRGLFKFRAEDYMSEIHGLFMSTFGDNKTAMAPMWI